MKETILSVVAVIIIVIVAAVFVLNNEKKKEEARVSYEEKPVVVTETPNDLTQSSELKIEDLTLGTGLEAVNGKKVTVHYTGTLTSGKKFDSSLDRGEPFSFNLGSQEVIKGWDLGVVGMKVGGKRRLTIPADLAYGSQGAGEAIPPNATLIFEIELLKVE